MNRISIFAIVSVLVIVNLAPLGAEEQKGIVSEFRAVEEAIRKKEQDPAILKATLQENIIRAMKGSITRRFFHTRDKYLADLKIDNVSYEKFEGTNTFYVKYKAFIVRYDFMRDPGRFIQAPVYEKFLIMDDKFDADHQDQPTNP